ncbi:hypothetical protein EHS25_006143 [Saitozyma podzolica]|uniref:Glycosyltransferase family 18 catalytic domain-containing protein n=1 Tax=Saitozyma podzolica TaxID=1890683 RepID=A0A427XTP3_9TREE|nr:hypothetical protein EHS25_006143 [Saitozyma podzolica]
MLTVRIPRRHGNGRLYLALFTAVFTVLAFQLLLGIDLWEEDGTDSSITLTTVWVNGDIVQESLHAQNPLSDPQVPLHAPRLPLPDPWRPGDLEILEWPESDDDKVVRWNQRELSEMYVCGARGTCAENQDKVVMFHTHWVMGTLFHKWSSGEGVWVMSMIKAIRRLGYTVLLSNDSEEQEDWDDLLAVYRELGDRVVAVVIGEADRCFKRESCVKHAGNPNGIPRWKVFRFSYFPHGMEDMTEAWMITAERNNVNPGNHTYIGFSYEDEAKSRPHIPSSDRAHQALVHAKHAWYFFMRPNELAWNDTFWQSASDDPRLQGISFRGTFDIDQAHGESTGWMAPGSIVSNITGVHNTGRIGPKGFHALVAESKIVIGLGNPVMSPSPYVALSMGTPYLNPIKGWDWQDPTNRDRWSTQHDHLARMDPPYVYNVHAGDYEGFVAAIKGAIENPPEPHILPDMTEVAVIDRVRKWLATDWEDEARKIYGRPGAHNPDWPYRWIL